MAAFVFSQVKIGNYEFVTNARVVDNDEELLQTISFALDGTPQISYIPKSPSELTEIKSKKSFTISGAENDGEQIELIKAELKKVSPIYFRNAQNEEFQVVVLEMLKFPNDSEKWRTRDYSFKVREI
jgi:hypothetical protein